MTEQSPLSGIDYFDRLATEFAAEKPRAGHSTECIAADNIAAQLRKKRIRILDVGCGTGRQWNKRHKKYYIAGLDGSSQMIALARQSRRFNKLAQVNFDDPTQNWPVRIDSFDLVICKDTLLYLSNITHVMKKLLESIKPHATLYITFREVVDPKAASVVETYLDQDGQAVVPVRWSHSLEEIKNEVSKNNGRIIGYEKEWQDGFVFHEMNITKSHSTPAVP